MHTAFQVHQLSPFGLELAGTMAEKFDTLLGEIEAQVTPCRELSIVTTKLEEACFYAKKALAKQHSYLG